MASIKVKFRPSAVADREGAVYYQIIHERKVRILPTSYRIFDSEWDNEHSTLSQTDKNAGRTDHLLAIRSAIRSDIERLASICRKLDFDCLCFTADDIVAEFNRMKTDNSLFNFMKKLIAGLKKRGNIRTSETYRSTLNSFASFRNYEDIMLDSISCSTMESYELWLRNRGLTPNTTSFYMRILRAVYNRAVENDMTENQSPFRHVYTGIEKTVKRALPLRTVRKIKELDLSQSPLLDFARNMFMMSFYLRGMSFIDMAFLKNLAADTKRLTAEKKAYKAQTAEARQEAETAMRERDEAKAERDAQRKEAVSNIANIFTGSNAKRLEAEVARKDNEIRELKDRVEAREQDFRREMSNLSDNLRRQKESEASTIRIHEYMKNDLNTFFPDVLPLLEAARE